MNFDHTADQQALAAEIAKQAHSVLAFNARQRRHQGFDAMQWRQLADLGWLGLALPERHGGMGEPLPSLQPILHALGAHAALLPLVAGVLEPMPLLLNGPADERLTDLAKGSGFIVLAHREHGQPSNADTLPQTTATPVTTGLAKGVRLHGHKCGVAWAADASHWIVSATQSGSASSLDASADALSTLSLWLLPANTPGVALRCYQGLDDTPMSDLTLSGVDLPDSACLARGEDARQRLQHAHKTVLAATCAEAVGAMEALHAQTVDHVKTREQFGGPIGRFQAVQHRLVDMLVSMALSRSLAWLALGDAQASSSGQDDRLGLIHAAKAQIASACRYVGEQAIQLHGGIGMTDECMASHLFRRLTALEKRGGDRHHHLGRLTDAVMAGQGTLYPV